MDQQEDDRMEAKVDATTHEMDPISVEKLVKKFKTHSCALDFDTTFCKATYLVCDLTQQRSKKKQAANLLMRNL